MSLNLSHVRFSLLAASLAASLFATSCRKAPESAAPVPAPVAEAAPVAKASDAQVQSLTDLSTQYETLQREADDANRKVVASLTQYQKRGGKLPPNFGPDLTDEQRAMLVERLQSERASTRTLLQDILERDKQIRDFREQIKTMDARLPEHVTAKEGDRHDRIAMNYLIAKGVPADKAFQIVSQMSLQDTLVPGFTVWTFYANGQFGTWVSRGQASVTPQEHQQRIAKVLSDERDVARKEATELRGQVEDAKGQAQSASAETQAVMDLLAKAQADKKAIEGVVRYSIGSKKQLVSMKVINGSLKLISIDAADQFSIDVNQSREIAIDGSTFALKAIKKVTLVPEVFIPGTDYQIEMEGPLAKLRLINLDKFKRNQFVIVIE